MDRYVFYDPDTGAILHTHQEVQADDADRGARAGGRLAEPAAEELAAMLERMGAPARTRRLVTDVPPLSSAAVERRVDVEREVVVTERLQPVPRRAPGPPDQEPGPVPASS